MKNYLIAIALMCTLSQTAAAAAQKHRHTPVAAVAAADTATIGSQQDAIDAFSDTTSVADDSLAVAGQPLQQVYSLDANLKIDDLLSGVDMEGLGAMLMVVAVVFIVFVLAPLLLIMLVWLLVRKNRNDRLRMAEMAVKNGQPIPEELLTEGVRKAGGEDDDLWQKGMRQTFLGIGLMVFLGAVSGTIGFGIGALVTCIGMGKLVIVKTSNMKQNPDDRPGHLF